jgi:hypothetical protein
LLRPRSVRKLKNKSGHKLNFMTYQVESCNDIIKCLTSLSDSQILDTCNESFDIFGFEDIYSCKHIATTQYLDILTHIRDIKRDQLVKAPYNLKNVSLAVYIANNIQNLDPEWLICSVMVQSSFNSETQNFFRVLSKKVDNLYHENLEMKIDWICNKYLLPVFDKLLMDYLYSLEI